MQRRIMASKAGWRHGRYLPLALAGAFAGCTPVVHQVTMDPGRLVGRALPHVACAYHLQDVTDARAAGDRVGGLGNNLFVFDDPARIVRQQLVASGVSAGEGAGKSVTLRILQLYLAQNTITKVPVVVYEVAPAGSKPFLVRSQKASMNWNGTQNEAYDAYASAFADATAQVIARLSQQCPGAPANP